MAIADPPPRRAGGRAVDPGVVAGGRSPRRRPGRSAGCRHPDGRAGRPRFVEETATAGLAHTLRRRLDVRRRRRRGRVRLRRATAGRTSTSPAAPTRPRCTATRATSAAALQFTPRRRSGDRPDRCHRRLPARHRRRRATDLAVLRVGETVLLRGLGDCRFERANEAWGLRRPSTAGRRLQRHLGGRGQALPTLAFGNYLEPRRRGRADLRLRGQRPAPARRRAAGLRRPDPARARATARCRCCSATGTAPAGATCGSPTTGTTTPTARSSCGGSPPGEAPRLYTADDGWERMQIWGMGIASQDLTGDGLPEVFLTSQGDNKLQTLTAGPGQPTYRDIALKRGVTAHRPFTGGDVLPSTAWHPEFADVNNDGFIGPLRLKGNVERDARLRQPQTRATCCSASPTARSSRGPRRRDPATSSAAAGPRWPTSTSTACSTWSRSTVGEPVRLWRNVGAGHRRGPGADGPLAGGPPAPARAQPRRDRRVGRGADRRPDAAPRARPSAAATPAASWAGSTSGWAGRPGRGPGGRGPTARSGRGRWTRTRSPSSSAAASADAAWGQPRGRGDA